MAGEEKITPPVLAFHSMDTLSFAGFHEYPTKNLGKNSAGSNNMKRKDTAGTNLVQRIK